MNWRVHHGDILEIPADVLVCSANVFLTLSGGVGGAFLLRFGSAMQDALTGYLKQRGIRHVEPGDVVVMPGFNSPYRAVVHAVAVDGFYDSTIDRVSGVIRASLREAAKCAAVTVAMTALATGYGRKPIQFFGDALANVLDEEFPPVSDVVVGVRSQTDADELVAMLPRLERI